MTEALTLAEARKNCRAIDEQIKELQEQRNAAVFAIGELALAFDEASDSVTKKPRRAKKKAPPRARSDGEAGSVDSSKSTKSQVAKYLEYEPAHTGCACGCGDETLGDNPFLRGHVNRLNRIVFEVDEELVDFSTIAPQAWEYVSNSERASKSLRDRCARAHAERVAAEASE